ncbi:MAG: class I SAM-dependent methyltransferase [Actinobacteria bacterium]|nr:MAG: class I SAM-dependent methyltransferase [Actinomycetota bacterium]
MIGQTIGRKFARLATNAAVRNPGVWRLFRPLIRWQFDSLASVWASMQLEDSLASYEAGLEALPAPPAHALDLGTGTGAGAVAIARRFPAAAVVGADLSDAMLAEARRRLPDELRARVEFQRADASALPFADGAFELVAHANMIPFFDELTRVLAPGGHALFAFSGGPTTPIYVTPGTLRAELERRGFTDFAELAAGRGNGLLARKGDHA